MRVFAERRGCPSARGWVHGCTFEGALDTARYCNRPNRRNRRHRRGVTLFEAVAAVTIVGMTSIAALAAVGAEFRTAERAQRALSAEALATNRLDAMELLSDRELQALPDSVAGGVFAEPLSEYSWKTTTKPVSDQAGVYSVRILIEWKGGSYDVGSYLYRRPPLMSSNR